MLLQYLEYKRQYSDCHLFFQVGDFYELFFDDAVTVSRTLNLTLTTRDKNDPDPVPMCGVPVSVVDNYIERLVSRGHSVALVSQADDTVTTKGNSKGAVQRRLERIITPGIRLCAASCEPHNESVVAGAVVEPEGDCAFAYSDVQTGKVFVREYVSVQAFSAELQRIGASELILPKSISGRSIDRRVSWVRDAERIVHQTGLKFRPESYLDGNPIGSREYAAIPGYSGLSATAKKAVRLLINYIDETTIGSQVVISEVAVRTFEKALMIDASTRINLELVRNLRDGSSSGTLFEHLDRTGTIGGQKLLRQWITHPLREVEDIRTRQAAVCALMEETALRERLVTLLRRTSDCERIAARLELGIVSPRELAALRDSLAALPELSDALAGINRSRSHLLHELAQVFSEHSPALPELVSCLADNPPLSSYEPGIIRGGFNAELDALRTVKSSGTDWMLELETSERSRTGISSLKIKFNNVLGYFIEVTKANISKVPENYIRRQSTLNAERFTTAELLDREREVSGADVKILALERELFSALKSRVRPDSPRFRAFAAALAQLDVLLSLAEVSVREGYTCPVVDDSEELAVTEGRHPILASRLLGSFVPNGLDMGTAARRCLIITGPNMGGKSTYIRQAGLIVIMAQIGCCVPAKAARIGVVDRMFARIGASDNLTEGESTFMVEMREASSILSSATSRSLLLIDEIGRGTATSDGLAIAQAIVEWIVLRLKSRTLFATHFHELTGLESVYPEITNLSVGSVDRDGEVVFTHLICQGPANRSYGIEVAKLAGLPQKLVQRSRELLSGIERQQESRRALSSQLALFERSSQPQTQDPADYPALKGLRAEIERIDINNLSPLDALVRLHELQGTLRAKT